MMGEDESRAFSLLKVNRKIHKKWIDRYSGKWLKEMGDGVLASFSSVSDAIYCAGAIQKESADISELNLRIGIHLGEVIVEVGDVFGDGVNIASRIESQAEAGSIYVSDAVYRNLTNKKGIAAAFVKEEVLKNVKHPVKIYEVNVDFSDENTQSSKFSEKRARARRRSYWRTLKKPLGIAALAIILVAFGYFIFGWLGNGSSESGNELKTVIVLPFENLGSPDDDYFAKGITDEITSRLSMIKGLSIISPLSASRFKESGRSVEEMAQELEVDFVLDGSIRWDKGSSSDKVRITPRLTNMSSNRQVWTSNYDRDLDQIFEVQSEIAERVSQALDITLLKSEKQSLQFRLTDNIQAYDLYLQGIDAREEISASQLRIAEEYFEEAIALDPDFAAAYARLGANHADLWWHYFDRDSLRLIKAKASIDKANELNPDLFEVKLASGQIHYHGFREYDEALAHLFDALEMKPNNSEVLSYIAYVKRRLGLYRECIDYMLRAYESDPLAGNIAFTLGETYELLRDYDESISFYDKGISLSPNYYGSYSQKAYVVYSSMGDIESSKRILESSLNKVEAKDVAMFDLSNFHYLDNALNEALSVLDQIKAEDLTEQFRYHSKHHLKADIYLKMDKQDLSRAYYDSARIFIENKIRTNPNEEKYHSTLGIIYARLGMNKEAIEEGLLGTQLMPQSLDAWAGYDRQLDLAKIYTLIGEQELAFEKIDYLLSSPGILSKKVLELDPVFDNLRTNRAYEEILQKQF